MDLVIVPLLALSDDPLSGKPMQTKVHAKHVRRLRQLRLARCLTKERAVEIAPFSGLRQLYLDGGAEDPTVLAEIGLGWRGKEPLQVIFGLSIHSPRPIFRQLPTLESVTYMIGSGETPSFADAQTARFLLGPGEELPSDLATWQRLNQLEVTVELGAGFRLESSPVLSLLTVNLRGVCTLSAEGSPLSFEAFSLRLKPKLLRVPEIEIKGDVRLFTALSMTLGDKHDPGLIVAQFPGLRRVRLSASPPRSRSEVEDIVDRIATPERVVSASQSIGTFQTEEYHSGSRSWTEYTDR